MKLRLALMMLCCLALRPAGAQDYHNVLTPAGATVANGPMQALIVDVPVGADRSTVRRLVAQSVGSMRGVRDEAIMRQVELLRRGLRYRGVITPAYGDIVYTRSAGRLVRPVAVLGRAGAELSFTFPAAGQPGAWPAGLQSSLASAIPVIYNEMKLVYGAPSWTGTLTILDGDTLPAGQIISDPYAVSGGILNLSTNEITLAQYNSNQSMLLSLTQMMAMAFRGSASSSFDAWERGMARAATVQTLTGALSQLKALPSFYGGTLGDLDVSDPMWQALDRYEWLNQPPLGNDRFFPVSRKDAEANKAGWPTMLVPRLQMSGSAWLKVLIESPTFLKEFNALYYAAAAGDPTVKGSSAALTALGTTALANAGGATVEGQPFPDWVARQYILDTAVSPGDKLYSQVSALRPDTDAADDYALAVITSYYRTGYDTSGNSDETDLDAVGYPIYWDFASEARLFLGAQYERLDIATGLGTVAPTFPNTIGGDPVLSGKMRIAVDLPINSHSHRIYAAPRCMGSIVTPMNFWGVVVGADAGTMRIEADGMASADIPVAQGAFGAKVDDAFFSRPRRATLTFTPTGGSPVTRRVNTGYDEYIAVFYATDNVESRNVQVSSGLQMASFPLLPLRSKQTDCLVSQLDGTPLFTDATLLMSQWRQSDSGDDKYRRSPSLDPIQPTRGYWTKFPSGVAIKLAGRTFSQDANVTAGLLHGWNQVGNPYEAAVPLTSLRFQYLADNSGVTLASAISNGWVVATDIPGVGSVAVWGYSPATGYYPAADIQPWKGYWMRTVVSEGVAMTYATVAQSGAPARLSVRSGWSVPVSVKSLDGVGATCYVGVSPAARWGANPKQNAVSPPPVSTSVPSIGFVHPEWGTGSAVYLSEIQPVQATNSWMVEARVPGAQRGCVLALDQASLPRQAVVTVVDTETGRRTQLQRGQSIAFTMGPSRTRRFKLSISGVR